MIINNKRNECLIKNKEKWVIIGKYEGTCVIY
jgi:hypothetical protein